jgi:S-adenosylmethionine hydrolase
VGVVDPGVGGPRHAIAVQTADYFFVGPDNGVLSWALAHERIKTVRRIEEPKYFLRTISRTFHGRDIFAPVAAHMSRGLPIQRLGSEVKDWVQLSWPRPIQFRGMVRGEIVYIDRFGNGLTNIEYVTDFNGRAITCEVTGRRKMRCTLAEFYGTVPTNRPVAVFGSSGFLEIAVNGGSAARKYGVKTGDAVVLHIGS